MKNLYCLSKETQASHGRENVRRKSSETKGITVTSRSKVEGEPHSSYCISAGLCIVLEQARTYMYTKYATVYTLS